MSAQAGIRHDGGDAETGFGYDVGGGLRLIAPAIGLTVEGHARAMIANWDHASAALWDIRNWSANASVQWSPGTDGLRPSLKLAPSWGSDPGSALWEQGATLAAATGGQTPAGRLEAEIGYGLAPFGGENVLTPYGGVALSDAGTRSYRAGIRFVVGQTVNLDLEGVRREPASGASEDTVQLGGKLRF